MNNEANYLRQLLRTKRLTNLGFGFDSAQPARICGELAVVNQ